MKLKILYGKRTSIKDVMLPSYTPAIISGYTLTIQVANFQPQEIFIGDYELTRVNKNEIGLIDLIKDKLNIGDARDLSTFIGREYDV